MLSLFHVLIQLCRHSIALAVVLLLVLPAYFRAGVFPQDALFLENAALVLGLAVCFVACFQRPWMIRFHRIQLVWILFIGYIAVQYLAGTGESSNPLGLGSVYAYATKRALFRVTALYCMLIAFLEAMRIAWFNKRILLILGINGALLCLIGISQWLSGSTTWLWISPMESKYPFATFRNHSHFAAYIGMLFPLFLSWVIIQQRRIINRSAKIPGMDSTKKKTLYFINRDGGLLIISAVILALGLLLSLSKGAIVSSVAALTVFSLMIIQFAKIKTNRYWIAGLGFAVIIGVVATDPAGILERYSQLSQIDVLAKRFYIPSLTLNMLPPFWIWGSGFGTFRSVFEFFTPPEFRGHIGFYALHAENEYLQVLVEGGVLSLGLLALFVFFVWKDSQTALKSLHKTHKDDVIFFSGLMASMVYIACHSFVDFSLRVPANALLFSGLIGYLIFVFEKTSTGFFEFKNRVLWVLIVTVSAGFLTGCFTGNVRIYRAQEDWAVNGKNLEWDYRRITLSQVKSALKLDPGNSDYHYLRAQIFEAQARRLPPLRRFYLKRCLAELKSAHRLNPWRTTYTKAILKVEKTLGIQEPDSLLNRTL